MTTSAIQETITENNPKSHFQTAQNSNQNNLIRVIRRNGKVTPYDDSKIRIAMTKAFLAVEGGNAAASKRIHEVVDKMTAQISAAFNRRMPDGGTIHIEDIQDQVELSLMRFGEQRIARAYVLYREDHKKQRESEHQKNIEQQLEPVNQMMIVPESGSPYSFDDNRLKTILASQLSV